MPQPTHTPRAKAVKEFLATHASARPEAKKDDDERETSVAAKGDILAHVIRLEHH